MILADVGPFAELDELVFPGRTSIEPFGARPSPRSPARFLVA